MKVTVGTDALVLEGTAELVAAMMICNSVAKSWWVHQELGAQARQIARDAARIDANGSGGEHGERCLPLTRAEALVLVDASRRFPRVTRVRALRGRPDIVAAAHRLAEVNL